MYTNQKYFIIILNIPVIIFQIMIVVNVNTRFLLAVWMYLGVVESHSGSKKVVFELHSIY